MGIGEALQRRGGRVNEITKVQREKADISTPPVSDVRQSV